MRFYLIIFSFSFQIRVVNAFRSSLYETRHYKRSMNSIASIHNFLPQINHHDDDEDDDDDQQHHNKQPDNDVQVVTTTTQQQQDATTNNSVVA